MVLSCAAQGTAQKRAWLVKPEWVRAHEEFLASDALGGRGSATKMEEIAASYVASEFIGYGLKPAPGMTGYLQTADVAPVTINGRERIRLADTPGPNVRKTFNAIGYLEGTDPASGTILLTAHLDHLGTKVVPAGEDGIYNGANDDAAGTTAVLELAHALAAGPRLRRNVLFVCYGSEELGGLGSTYFGEHPPVPLTTLVANLEFEMIGNQDPKMPPGVLLLTGWDRSNLGPTLRAHGALLGPDPYPEQHFFQRSDNYSLALKGVVAHTAAGRGTVPTYHKPDDDLAHLDLPFMTAAIQSLVQPIRWLATSNFKPTWNPGGQPTGR
jgi:aminopeptidase YwaD